MHWLFPTIQIKRKEAWVPQKALKRTRLHVQQEMCCVNFDMGVNPDQRRLISIAFFSPFFWNIFSFLLLTFNTKKNSLFFEKNGNTTSPFYGQKIFVCALCCANPFLGFSFSVISKKPNKFPHSIVSKKKNCMIPSCSPVFLWTLFYFTSLLQFIFDLFF